MEEAELRTLFVPTAFLFAVGLTGIAQAADLSVTTAPPAPVEQAGFSWTGFYVGLNAGGGFGGDDKVGLHAGDSYLGSFGKLKSSGFLGGVQAGYNYQIDPNWLIGIEADFQGADISDSTSVAGVHSSSKIDWFGTVRPRIGYVYDRTLIYATGGLSYGHIKYTGAFNDMSLIDESKTRAGWVLGAGVEHAFTDHLTARLEYQYVDFGHFDAGDNGIWAKATPDFHSLRVALNYKF